MDIRLGYRLPDGPNVATGQAQLDHSVLTASLAEPDQNAGIFTTIPSSLNGSVKRFLAKLTKQYQDPKCCPVHYYLVRLPGTRQWFGFYLATEDEYGPGLDLHFLATHWRGLGLAWATI